MTIYGYARCSTNESKQDITRQTRELIQLGATKETIYFEYESGTKVDRVQLNRLLEVVQEGDTVVTTEVSRITRSTKQLCEIIELVQEKNIKLVLGAFVVDCSKGELDPMTEGMLKMMGVFAEMERNMISQRVKSGMENAKAKGKQIGRKETTKEDIPPVFLKHYDKYKVNQQDKEHGNKPIERRGINLKEFMSITDLSKNTIYKYIKLMEESSQKVSNEKYEQKEIAKEKDTYDLNQLSAEELKARIRLRSKLIQDQQVKETSIIYKEYLKMIVRLEELENK